jgi:DNA-binding transcriptional LysR family regulator
MAPIDLNFVRAFVMVHETASFSEAGARLGCPRSTVSRAVVSLEEALGLQLFHRTTRKVTTTEAGLALYQRLSPSLSAMEATLSEAPEGAEAPTGTLRITTTVDLGMSVVAPAIARFTARYPTVHAELHTGDDIVDLAKEGFDLALRVAHGPLRGGAPLMAHKVGRIEVQLFASPAYLARRGTPRTPADLASHDWVALRGFRAPSPPTEKWPRGPSKAPDARVTCDNIFVLRDLLRNGGGIGTLPVHLAESDIAEGRLVGVLPQWFQISGTLYLVYPSRRHVPPKVTLFRDILVDLLRRTPLAVPGGDGALRARAQP